MKHRRAQRIRPIKTVVSVGVGECVFTRRDCVLTTVLGSCVSVTAHHPNTGAAGLSHAFLPTDKGDGLAQCGPCRFADTAPLALLDRFAALGIPPHELVLGVYGGARSLTAGARGEDFLDVGAGNVAATLDLLAELGLTAQRQDVLGDRGRKLWFDAATGAVRIEPLGEPAPRVLAPRSFTAVCGVAAARSV